jgi:hypothetical protein
MVKSTISLLLETTLVRRVESSQVMSCVAVVLFDRKRPGFTDYVPLRRQNLHERIPLVCVERAVFQVLHFIVQASESCAITITENPGDCPAAAAINGLDEPKFPFFDSMKCHISSNSTCVISPSTVGSAVRKQDPLLNE